MIRVSVEQTNCRLTTEQWWRTHKAGHRRKNKMNHKTQSPTDIWTHNSTSHTRIQLAEPALANPSREKVLLHDLCRLLGLLATREKIFRSAYDGFVLLCYADGLWFWLFINHKIISSNLKQCVFRDIYICEFVYIYLIVWPFLRTSSNMFVICYSFFFCAPVYWIVGDMGLIKCVWCAFWFCI